MCGGGGGGKGQTVKESVKGWGCGGGVEDEVAELAARKQLAGR